VLRAAAISRLMSSTSWLTWSAVQIALRIWYVTESVSLANSFPPSLFTMMSRVAMMDCLAYAVTD
jgi:hypothetical protein